MELTEDDRPPTDPAESLRLIERERAETGRQIIPDPRLLLWPWGLAWLVGFTLFFLRFGPGDRVFVNLPAELPLVVLLALIMAAGLTTAVVSTRAGRSISGPTSRQGLMYGAAWSLSFFGMCLALSRVSPLLPASEANLLWAGSTVAVTGALHMAGGAIWHDRRLFVLGTLISAVNIAGVLAGPGWHALVVAIGGGGGMLVAGYLGWLRWRR